MLKSLGEGVLECRRKKRRPGKAIKPLFMIPVSLCLSMMIAAIIRQSLPMFGLKRVFEFYRSAALKEGRGVESARII
jgi:hypothetical protein